MNYKFCHKSPPESLECTHLMPQDMKLQNLTPQWYPIRRIDEYD